MTVAEIFGKISAHMVEGMMFHEQMSDYYDFLALDGYSCCHQWHYICETKSRSDIHRFYIGHYNKLLWDEKVDAGSVIPTGWANATRFDVDVNTKKSAVKSGASEWLKWERQTRDLYLEMYRNLCDLNEIVAAEKISELICDVDKEIHIAEEKNLKLIAVGYDMNYICDEQRHLLKKYKHRMEEC